MPELYPVSPFTLPRAGQFKLTSRAEKRQYRIYLYTPEAPPPVPGYPVVYALDANAIFGTLVETARLQSRPPHGFGPVVVVGIGYDTDEPFNEARYYDFTTPADPTTLPARRDGSEWPPTGGADAFLDFIESELKPLIEQEYRVDRNRQTLCGHSLGGFFTLHTLFTRPGAFQNYVAGSPSIWWNNRALLKQEERFVNRLATETVRARLMIGVGELERDHQSRIVENAEEMAGRLADLDSQGLRVIFREFSEEGHISVLPPLLSRALNFAMQPAQ